MEPSDRHRWTNFVTSCTLDQSVDHLCHQGSDLSHCRQLPQLPSSNSYRAYIAVQQLLAVPRQRSGDGATLTTHRLPGRPSTIIAESSTSCAGCGNTLSAGHERREVQQWIGNYLCPTDWGWQYRDESLVPLTTDLPIAPTRVLLIVSCGCKTGW